MRQLISSIVLVVALCASSAGCGASLQAPPPNLSPAAQQAFRYLQTQKVLDLVRDVAVDANAQKKTDGTPLVSEATTREIVRLHETAIKMMNASTSGWAAVVYQQLTDIVAKAPPADKSVLGTYFNLALSTLKGLL